MKTRNKKDLEKHWAEQAKKAAKLRPKAPPEKKSAQADANQTPPPALEQGTKA